MLLHRTVSPASDRRRVIGGVGSDFFLAFWGASQVVLVVKNLPASAH